MDKKLSPLAAGLAFGIYFGVGLFIIGLLAWLTGYCKIFVSFMSTFYIGYTYTFLGSLMGIVRGFVDGFIGAYIVVWLYNLYQKKGNKGCWGTNAPTFILNDIPMRKILFLSTILGLIFLVGCGKKPAATCDSKTSNACPLPTITGQQNALTGVISQ